MKKTLPTLCQSLIISHIRYCTSTWCFGNEAIIDKLQRLRKQIDKNDF